MPNQQSAEKRLSSPHFKRVDLSPEPVSIIGGTGALGFGLALRLAQAGLSVVIGSRDPARAIEAAGRVADGVAGATVIGLSNADAAAANEMVIFAIPFQNHAQTLQAIVPSLTSGQLLVDTTVPLAATVGGRATRVLGVWQGSAAQQAQEIVGSTVQVVSALHSVAASHLTDLAVPLDEDTLICGDSKADRERVARVLGLIPGLRPVHGGPLEYSRYTEQMTPLLIGLNARYKTAAGIRFTNLPG